MRMSIYYNNKLSEDFIRNFKDEINWTTISRNQKLSEYFIREFKDKVDWCYISIHQELSEDFIQEFKDRVDWRYISINQELSGDFIQEFKGRVDWYYISIYQKLSKGFIKEFKNRINLKFYLDINKKRTRKEKIKEMMEYAVRYNLKFDGNYLYAYRVHDHVGRGIYNFANFYEKGKYYKDFHCDMREEIKNSFGLGIFSLGNIKVKISVKDFGVWINGCDKCRVWGFTTIS